VTPARATGQHDDDYNGYYDYGYDHDHDDDGGGGKEEEGCDVKILRRTVRTDYDFLLF
jgi:hypothetical protein